MIETTPELCIKDDARLIERFVRDGSEEAFRVLTARYAPLVFGTCRRILRDSGLAEDASQTVFVLLAWKAAGLRNHPSLVGWLHACARNVSHDLLRKERRRMQLERSAFSVPEISESLDRVLDDGLARLKPSDRELIVRRFLYGETLAELAANLSIAEDAARMRVNRALEALRRTLVRAGFALTIGALETALSQTADAAPPSLLSRLAAQPVPRPTIIPKAMMTLPPIAISAAMLVVGATLVFQGRSPAREALPPTQNPAPVEARKFLAEIVAELPGTWNVSIVGATPSRESETFRDGEARSGGVEERSFRGVAIRYDEAKSQIVFSHPTAKLGPWDVDAKRGEIRTLEGRDGAQMPFFHPVSTRRSGDSTIGEYKANVTQIGVEMALTIRRDPDGYTLLTTGKSSNGDRRVAIRSTTVRISKPSGR